MTLARIYHLARTGGTLLSRSLASMQHVALLSEIHPSGTSRFNPLEQAHTWYGLVPHEDVHGFNEGDEAAVLDAVLLIHQRCEHTQRSLILRDWSHLDWIGIPFLNPPPRQFTWERLLANHPTFAPYRCATVRHPLDHFLSLSQLSILQSTWNPSQILEGMLAFARAVQSIPWFRYETFLLEPENTLQQICEVLSVPYDSQWQSRWMHYTNITGDALHAPRPALQRAPRKPIPDSIWQQLRREPAFFEILDLLHYPTPDPLRGAKPMLLAPDKSPANDDWDASAAHARDRYEQNPSSLDLLLSLAEALVQSGAPQSALEVVNAHRERSTETSVENTLRLLRQLVELYQICDRRFESIPYRRSIAELAPLDTQNLFQLTNLLVGTGAVEEALTYSQRLLELDRNHTAAATNHLLYVNYSDQYTPAQIANEHFRLAMQFSSQADFRVPPAAHRARFRIGYLGADFYVHPVGKLMLPLLEAHDRNEFEIFVYHDNARSDGITQSTRDTVDTFRTTHGMDDIELLETIRKDQVDVLFELGGYTGGGNRLKVLARQAAPIQASFLGYPNTSALRSIHYRFTDRFADPPGVAESLYGERLLWLEHAHLAWRPYEIASEIISRPSPVPRLGLFNNVSKIAPSAIKAYAQILKRVPQAKLVLKYGDRFGVRCVQDRYRELFAAQGVLPHRLEFVPQALSLEAHLQRFADVDLALDTFPYQGTMTSLECLCVGTPIVSRCGSYYAHRATSAMMMRLGFPQLVAEDDQEYIEIAVQLLQDLPLLRSLRGCIRERFYQSPLTDPAGLIRELETRLLTLPVG